MDMNIHLTSGATVLVTGKAKQIYIPESPLLLGRGNQHSTWRVEMEKLPARARCFG